MATLVLTSLPPLAPLALTSLPAPTMQDLLVTTLTLTLPAPIPQLLTHTLTLATPTLHPLVVATHMCLSPQFLSMPTLRAIQQAMLPAAHTLIPMLTTRT